MAFQKKCWASRSAAWNILQSKVFQIWVKHLKTPSTVPTDLNPHFATNLAGSFWVPKLKSMSAVSLLHAMLCQLLSPTHVESGGCCGPAYMAGTVGLMAPGATEMDRAPHGKSQPWADKGFHMSSRVSLSRAPACFLLCRKGFSVHRCDGKLMNSTSRESMFPILSQNQQSLCSSLAVGKW